MTRARAARALPLALVLGSGLGLLAVGGSGLWRSLQDARARVELLGAQESRRVAEGMRAALAQPALLDRAPRSARFTVRDGALVVPAAVAFLHEPHGDRVVPALADTALTARIARLGAGGADAAGVAELRAAIDAADAEAPRASAHAWLAASWFAHRIGDATWRDALRERLRQAIAQGLLGDAVADRVLVSLALLAAHVGEREASDADLERFGVALARQGAGQADAVIARLAELRADAGMLARLRARVEETARWRTTLARVSAALPRIANAREPVVERLDDDLLVFLPAADGEGAGAVLAAHATLQEVFAAQAPADGVELTLAAVAAAGASPVVPGVAAVVHATTAPAAPWLLAALAVALGLLFTGALVTTLRGVRQQGLAQAARAEFLTSVTHELKTPLSSLRLLSEMLASGRVQREQQRQEYHDLIAGETARLCALVDNVLDLGRTERGERGFDMQPVNSSEFVSDTNSLVFLPDAGEVRVQDEGGGALVRADRSAVAQALINVLDNARKYGGVERGIEVRVEADHAEVRIAVRDHGPGVPVGERERIFAKFARGRAQADGHVPGLGLGLYLARGIARAHGGDLVCRTPDDGAGGAEFVLRLPRAEEGA